MGKKKQPHYRIVATDSRFPRDGRFVEILGYYNPVPHPAKLSVDLSRVDYWTGRGAIVSPTVRSLVAKARAGGDEKVALAVAERAPGAEADAPASAENGAAADAPATAAGDEAAADTPEAEAADAPTAATGDGDAPEADTAPESGDTAEADDTAPESGAA